MIPRSPANAATPSASSIPERLESWKEIAAYLKRSVSTVQRWEQEEGLPVHRLLHAKAGSVYALTTELVAWLVGRDLPPDSEPSPGDPHSASRASAAAAAADVSLTVPNDGHTRRPRPTSWRRTASRVVLPTAILAGVIGGLAVWHVQPSSSPAIVRTQLNVDPAANVDSGWYWYAWTRGGARTALMWVPNGRALVFIGSRDGTRQIYLRDLARSDARRLAGTEKAHIAAVTPDGQFVVFWANGEFRRVPLDGGPAESVFPERLPPGGMAVGASGRIVFNREFGGIWQSTAGSAPTAVTSLGKGETAHILPQLLANDTVLLFTIRTSSLTWGRERVVVQVLATGERRVLLQDAADARYVPSGHLVFLRRGLLMAVAFDLARLAVTGPPLGVLNPVAQSLTASHSGDVTGGGQFSVSATGALAYIPSPVVPYPKATLAMVDRRGHVSALAGEVRSYWPTLRLSPDGRRVAVSVMSPTELALGVIDLARTSFTKLTAEGEASNPRWTPDGQRIAFQYTRDGVPQLAWQPADGSAGPDTLVQGVEGEIVPSSWSPDGRYLVAVKDYDLWVLTVGDPSSFSPLTATPEKEQHPEFSPDGRALAYTSNETGRWEVYVRPYPLSGPSIPVSTAGGSNPAWNPKGGELFFLSEPTADAPRRRMMAVAIVDRRPGTARPLFEAPFFECTPVRCYDVTPDGHHFVFTRELPQDPLPPVTHINLVLNWVDELKAKVPVR